MSDDLSKKVLFLNPRERVRLAAWLSQLEPVRAINPGRWQQLCDGSTDYISQKELQILSDQAQPVSYASDIIRGTVEIKVSEVQ